MRIKLVVVAGLFLLLSACGRPPEISAQPRRDDGDIYQNGMPTRQQQDSFTDRHDQQKLRYRPYMYYKPVV